MLKDFFSWLVANASAGTLTHLGESEFATKHFAGLSAREANAANNSRDSGLDGKQKGASKPKRLQIRRRMLLMPAQFTEPSVESQVVEFSGMRLRLDTAQPAILTEDDIMTVESVTDPNKLKASQIVLTLMPEAGGERFLIEQLD